MRFDPALGILVRVGTFFLVREHYRVLDCIAIVGDKAWQKMAGSFSWTYTAGDFENGVGVFSEIYVPGWGTDLSGLNITIDPSSIEVSLVQNLDSTNVGVTLKLNEPLTLTTGSLLDLTTSKWEDFDGGNYPFISGSVEPNVVPVPAAVWLFGSGLIGLLGVAKRKKPA
jgi:hypothetical protein